MAYPIGAEYGSDHSPYRVDRPATRPSDGARVALSDLHLLHDFRAGPTGGVGLISWAGFGASTEIQRYIPALPYVRLLPARSGLFSRQAQRRFRTAYSW